MMDAADRELFERSVSETVSTSSGRALDDALHDLGWLDALADDDRAAVSILFEQLGRHHATGGALDHLVGPGAQRRCGRRR